MFKPKMRIKGISGEEAILRMNKNMAKPTFKKFDMTPPTFNNPMKGVGFKAMMSTGRFTGNGYANMLGGSKLGGGSFFERALHKPNTKSFGNIMALPIHHISMPGLLRTNFGKSMASMMSKPSSNRMVYSSLGAKSVDSLGWNRVKQQTGLPMWGDADGDGMPNILDCQPFNRKKQTDALHATPEQKEQNQVGDVIDVIAATDKNAKEGMEQVGAAKLASDKARKQAADERAKIEQEEFIKEERRRIAEEYKFQREARFAEFKKPRESIEDYRRKKEVDYEFSKRKETPQEAAERRRQEQLDRTNQGKIDARQAYYQAKLNKQLKRYEKETPEEMKERLEREKEERIATAKTEKEVQRALNDKGFVGNVVDAGKQILGTGNRPLMSREIRTSKSGQVTVSEKPVLSGGKLVYGSGGGMFGDMRQVSMAAKGEAYSDLGGVKPSTGFNEMLSRPSSGGFDSMMQRRPIASGFDQVMMQRMGVGSGGFNMMIQKRMQPQMGYSGFEQVLGTQVQPPLPQASPMPQNMLPAYAQPQQAPQYSAPAQYQPPMASSGGYQINQASGMKRGKYITTKRILLLQKGVITPQQLLAEGFTQEQVNRAMQGL